ncbi:MAG: hypothetical protein BM556_17690 [Bacteriovorax sp. MedPE-SWde]|nr:MAG: hypothetical protein BM556_17690 [Bacteriovorax sp. MedPE-SWde]
MLKKSLTTGEIAWNSIIFVAVILTALEAPYSFTFGTRIQKWQLVSDFIISLIFIIDICYQVRQRVKGRAQLNTTTEKFNWWSLLIVDVMAAIPFDIISYSLGGASGIRFFNLLRLFRLVRVIRIIQLFGKLPIVSKAVRVNIYIIFFVIIVQWVSCGWILINPQTIDDQTTHFIKAVYWTVTTLTTIGYGDITPTTNIGRLYTMVIMILGVGIYGIVIGNVTRMMAAGDRHKEMARERMTDLGTFMKYYNIPERLQNNVSSYYQHLITKRLTDNDNKIINELPQALQQELQIYMNIKLIRNIPIFKDCSQQCLKDVAGALQQKYYGPGQTIINIGEVGQEMFIIGHGIVEVILKDGNTVATLHENQFFGEGALVRETKRNANVRAQSYCDLYRLEKVQFEEIIARHPDLLDSIERVANKRSSDRRAPRTPSSKS